MRRRRRRRRASRAKAGCCSLRTTPKCARRWRRRCARPVSRSIPRFTADEALARLDVGERYDAVFTDVVIPGVLSGVDLALEVRRRFPRVGVVVATGYSDRAVQIEGVRALPKPYDRHQAVEALNAAMAGGSD